MRKRNVQKEADLPFEAQVPQAAGEGHELVVVYPDDVIRPQEAHKLMRELRIDAQVRLVLLLLVLEAGAEVVKQGPQGTVAVPVVVRIELRGLQIDGGKPDVAARSDLRLRIRLLRGLTAPAKPQATSVLQGPEHANGQATGRGTAAGYRNAIGYTD